MIPKIPQILALITPSCFGDPLRYLQPVGRRKNYTIWSNNFLLRIQNGRLNIEYSSQHPWRHGSKFCREVVRETHGREISTRVYLCCVVVCIQLIRHNRLKKKTGTRLRHRGMPLDWISFSDRLSRSSTNVTDLRGGNIISSVLFNYNANVQNGLSREKIVYSL